MFILWVCLPFYVHGVMGWVKTSSWIFIIPNPSYNCMLKLTSLYLDDFKSWREKTSSCCRKTLIEQDCLFCVVENWPLRNTTEGRFQNDALIILRLESWSTVTFYFENELSAGLYFLGSTYNSSHRQLKLPELWNIRLLKQDISTLHSSLKFLYYS